ncbi:MAG: hypothetical protein ABI895_24090 [Deltaproteobacteria bacterium]
MQGAAQTELDGWGRMQGALSNCQAERRQVAGRVHELEQQVSVLRTAYVQTASSREFRIQAAADDDVFVIDGHVFKAKTYCFGVEAGDRVVFIEGSGTGACTSAKFIEIGSDRICDVWCE